MINCRPDLSAGRGRVTGGHLTGSGFTTISSSGKQPGEVNVLKDRLLEEIGYRTPEFFFLQKGSSNRKPAHFNIVSNNSKKVQVKQI